MDSIGAVPLMDERRGAQTLQRVIDEVKRLEQKPTHFLLIFFRFADNPEVKSKSGKVRAMLFQLIKNKRFTMSLGENDEVFIKWTTMNSSSSILYYTTSRFEETYVRQLTRGLMSSVFREVTTKLNLTVNDVQLNYMTTKNMEFTIDLETGHQEFIGNAFPTTPLVNFNEGDDSSDSNETA